MPLNSVLRRFAFFVFLQKKQASEKSEACFSNGLFIMPYTLFCEATRRFCLRGLRDGLQTYRGLRCR